MTHTHRFRPLWLLLCSPAWADGYHRIVTHAQCIVCHETIYLAAWQSPRHVQGKQMEADT